MTDFGRFGIALACLSLALSPQTLIAGDFVPAEQQQAKIAIYAPGENEWAGRRLADRLLKLTGAPVIVHTGEVPPADPSALVVIGTLQSNSVVKSVVGADDRVDGLGDEGYLLKTASWQDRAVLVASGRSLAGVNNAVSELVSWKLKLSDGGAAVASDLNETDKPALRYRMVWTWDGNCNWSSSVEETMK